MGAKKFHVYTGKGSLPDNDLGSRVFKFFTEPVPSQVSFTSEKLLADLEENGIYVSEEGLSRLSRFTERIKVQVEVACVHIYTSVTCTVP